MFLETAQIELVVQRRMRFVLPIDRLRWRIGQRFWYLPFSRNLYMDWFGAQLAQTKGERFGLWQSHFGWTGLARSKPWGLEFHTVVDCPTEFTQARAMAFADAFEKNLGAGWKVVGVVSINGDLRQVLR